MRARFQMDARLLGAGLLAAVAALTVLIVTSPPERTSILVARSNLPPGVPLGELDLGSRDVESAVGLIALEDVDALDTHTLSAPLAIASPIPRSLLLAPGSEQEADLLGLELDSAAAVHGRLTAGDLVDVYAVAEDAYLIAEAVPIVDVEIASTSLGSGRVRLIVAVAGEIGPRLVAASESGEIHLVRRGS